MGNKHRFVASDRQTTHAHFSISAIEPQFSSLLSVPISTKQENKQSKR